MNHNEVIRDLLAMPTGTRRAFGSVDVKRDPTGDYWCATTPRGYTAYFHCSGMAAIVISWNGFRA